MDPLPLINRPAHKNLPIAYISDSIYMDTVHGTHDTLKYIGYEYIWNICFYLESSLHVGELLNKFVNWENNCDNSWFVVACSYRTAACPVFNFKTKK